MSSGFNEILLIVVILLAILFIPRMTAPTSRFVKKPKRPPFQKIMRLGPGWRLALLVTLIWFLGATAYFRPWTGDLGIYLMMGIGPLLIGWGIAWVVAGLLGKKN